MLKYKIYNSFEGKCLEDWKEISLNGSYNFFQSYDYLKGISFKNQSNLKIVSIFYKNKIIAFLPLEIRKLFFIKILQWIGTEISDYCNPIISKNFYDYIQEKEFEKIWNNILADIGHFDLILFNNQPSNISNSLNPFTKYLHSIEFSKIYKIELDGNINEYFKNLKSKDNKKFYEIQRTLNKLKSLHKDFNVDFEYSDLNDNKIDFKQVVYDKIYQLRKKGVKNKLNKDFIEIFQNLIKLNQNKFILSRLKINNENVSSCVGIVLNNVYYYYIPMLLSKNYNNFKPGKILILKIIEWCYENKIKYFDFGLGDEKYKENFSNISMPLHRYLTHRSFLGKIFILLLKIIFFKKKFN